MSLQLSPGPGRVLYAPARDVVWMLPHIIKNAATRMEEKRFKTLHDLLEEKGVKPEELAKAVDTFVALMQQAPQQSSGDLVEALRKAGWFDIRDEARIAFIFYIGAQLMGTMWVGVRDASVGGDEALENVERLCGLGDRVAQALTTSKWRRILRCFLGGIRRWLARKLQGSG